MKGLSLEPGSEDYNDSDKHKLFEKLSNFLIIVR